MKHLHSFPVDCWKSRERFEELKLGSASRCDQPCLSLLLNRVAQHKRGLVRCNPRHLFLIVEALDHHFNYSPDQGSMRIPRRSPTPHSSGDISYTVFWAKREANGQQSKERLSNDDRLSALGSIAPYQ